MITWLRKLLVCFIAGAGAGIGTGFIGMSAAAVVGPLLITFLDIPAFEAVGIGLASDVLASAVSARIYRKHGHLDIKGSLPLLISVLVMTVVGSWIANYLPDFAMGCVVQIAMIIMGIIFIFKPIESSKLPYSEMTKKNRIIRSVIGGMIIGFICGFVGAGGGMMMLVVLTMFLGFEIHVAVGTSVFVMAFTALTGSLSHFTIGSMPDVDVLIYCIVFTLLWARVAAKIANNAKPKTLSRIVGVILIVIAIVILFVDYI